MKGAFQTSREIFENPIWNDVPKFRLFFYIVGNAVFSHEGIKKGGITIERGQYLRSYRNLRSDLEYIENRSIKKYSLSLIKRKVEQLVKEERLKVEETELGTLFTVVNYATYQGFDHYKNNNENAEETEREQSENGDRTEREQTQNNNKNVKKEKNVKEYTEDFERFWKEYPRKKDKKMAFKSFKSRAKEHSVDNIIKGAKGYSAQVKKEGTESKFIKHGATFLNNDSFLDYLESQPEDKPSKPKKSKAQLDQERMMEEMRRERANG